MIGMDEREYQRLRRAIDEKFKSGLAKLEAERNRRLEVLNEFRSLFQDESSLDNPRPISRPALPGNQTGNGSQAGITKREPTQREQVKLAVEQVDGDVITQPIVLAKLVEIAPKLAETIHPTNISKILRSLEEDGKLKLVRKAHASQPTVYKRTKAM